MTACLGERAISTPEKDALATELTRCAKNERAIPLEMLIEQDAQMRAPEERTMDFGAHQACCPLLQTLFMTARAPTMSTVTAKMINTEVFIATSPLRAPRPTGR